MGGEPRKTPPHCLWFLLPGWAVVPPTVARLKVGCVCVCVCKLFPEEGRRALGTGSGVVSSALARVPAYPS